MPVITRGDHEISLRFESFPEHCRAKLEERIRELTLELEARVRAAAPVKTGLLRSEVAMRIYSGSSSSQNRIAGYVSVFAGSRSKEYAKAATLEYGSDKARKLSDRLGSGLLARLHNRAGRRMSRVVHIEARRYLRGPLEQMQPEIMAALDEAVSEAIEYEI